VSVSSSDGSSVDLLNWLPSTNLCGHLFTGDELTMSASRGPSYPRYLSYSPSQPCPSPSAFYDELTKFDIYRYRENIEHCIAKDRARRLSGGAGILPVLAPNSIPAHWAALQQQKLPRPRRSLARSTSNSHKLKRLSLDQRFPSLKKLNNRGLYQQFDRQSIQSGPSNTRVNLLEIGKKDKPTEVGVELNVRSK